MNSFITIGFILLSFVFDTALQAIMPIDFEMRRLFFVSNLGIVGLILSVRQMDLKSAMIVALVAGLIMDLTHYGYFLLYASVYVATVLLVRFWSNHVNDSRFELLILGILTIFVKESLVFILMRLIGSTHLTFLNWFVYREFLTLMGHVPLVLMLLSLDEFRLSLLAGHESTRRRRENPLFINVPRRS